MRRRRRTVGLPRPPSPPGTRSQASLYLGQLRAAACAHEAAWIEFRERLQGPRAADERARRELHAALRRFHQASAASAALPSPPAPLPAATLPALERLWTLLCRMGEDTAAYTQCYLEAFEGKVMDPATLAAADQRIRHAGDLYTESQRALKELRPSPRRRL